MPVEPVRFTAPADVMVPAAAMERLPPIELSVVVPEDEIEEFTAIAPVLVTEALPPPVSLMPVIVSGLAVLTRLTLPLPVLVPLKLPTVFALVSVVPPTELVVSRPVVPKVP